MVIIKLNDLYNDYIFLEQEIKLFKTNLRICWSGYWLQVMVSATRIYTHSLTPILVQICGYSYW